MLTSFSFILLLAVYLNGCSSTDDSNTSSFSGGSGSDCPMVNTERMTFSFSDSIDNFVISGPAEVALISTDSTDFTVTYPESWQSFMTLDHTGNTLTVGPRCTFDTAKDSNLALNTIFVTGNFDGNTLSKIQASQYVLLKVTQTKGQNNVADMEITLNQQARMAEDSKIVGTNSVILTASQGSSIVKDITVHAPTFSFTMMQGTSGSSGAINTPDTTQSTLKMDQSPDTAMTISNGGATVVEFSQSSGAKINLDTATSMTGQATQSSDGSINCQNNIPGVTFASITLAQSAGFTWDTCYSTR